MWSPLSHKKTIQHIFKAGCFARTATMSIRWSPNGLTQNRLAIVALRAGLPKSSVRRNRLRRIGRALYHHYDSMGLSEGFDLLLFIHPSVEKQTMTSRLDDLAVLLQKSRMLRSERGAV